MISQIRSEFYTDKPDGICGNEDCGQMSAWYVLNAMGFYPVCPGSNQYSIGKPLFETMTMNLEDGKAFTVSTVNMSDSNKYIQKVLLDGNELTSPFINHSDIAAGKQLKFIMGNNPTVFWSKD